MYTFDLCIFTLQDSVKSLKFAIHKSILQFLTGLHVGLLGRRFQDAASGLAVPGMLMLLLIGHG